MSRTPTRAATSTTGCGGGCCGRCRPASTSSARRAGERRNAMTLNWATQVSFEPKLLGIGVEKDGAHPRADRRGRRVHALHHRPRGPGHRPQVHQAGRGRPRRRRRSTASRSTTASTGAPILDPGRRPTSTARSARPSTCGGHTLFIGEVVDAGFHEGRGHAGAAHGGHPHELRRLIARDAGSRRVGRGGRHGSRVRRRGADRWAQLAGWAGTRRSCEVDGRPMAARVADALRAAGAAPVVAVGGDRAGAARRSGSTWRRRPPPRRRARSAGS